MRALLLLHPFCVRPGSGVARSRRGLLARCLLLGAAVVVAACGGGEGVAPAPSSADGAAFAYATNVYSQQVSALPLTLAVDVDNPRAVALRVSAALGGVLRATGADGASFEFTVPPDALAADVEVTMTPIARFIRLPFNGADTASAWGVQLAPSGTRFLKPARLRITPPAGVSVPVDQQLAFGWDGDAVQLALLDPASREVDVQVLHFSGYAVGRFAARVDVTNAALQNLRDRLGPTPERRLESVAAERAAAKRRAALTGIPDRYQISSDDFQNYFDGYLDGTVRPRLDASGGCANSRVAFETVLNVQNTLEAMNEAPPSWGPLSAGRMETLMMQVAQACLTLEHVRCVNEHVVTEIINAVQGIDSEARRVVSDPWSAYWRQWRAQAEEKVAQCHRYRLDIDSTSGSDTPGQEGWHFSEAMEGIVELHLSGPVLEFSDPIGAKSVEIVGVGEVPSRSYSISYPDSCTVVAEVVQAPTLFSVSHLSFARASNGGLDDLRLEYFPGSNPSNHLITHACSSPQTQARLPMFAWSNTFLVSVGSDARYFDASKYGFYLDRWIMDLQPASGGEKTLATQVIEPALVDDGITFKTLLNLRIVHTPQR